MEQRSLSAAVQEMEAFDTSEMASSGLGSSKPGRSIPQVELRRRLIRLSTPGPRNPASEDGRAGCRSKDKGGSRKQRPYRSEYDTKRPGQPCAHACGRMPLPAHQSRQDLPLLTRKPGGRG